MPDIFSRTIDYGNAFSADGTTITFGNDFGAGMLAQSVEYSYQQNITRLNELGSNKIYVVAGSTQGTATVQRILGPTPLASEFYETYGDVCDMGGNSLSMSMAVGCASDTGATQIVNLQYVVIAAVIGRITVQDYLYNEGLTLMFLSLEMTCNPPSACGA